MYALRECMMESGRPDRELASNQISNDSANARGILTNIVTRGSGIRYL